MECTRCHDRTSADGSDLCSDGLEEMRSESAGGMSGKRGGRMSGKGAGKDGGKEGGKGGGKDVDVGEGLVSRGSSSIPEGLFDCFAVLDFEATCQDDSYGRLEPQEIIELPIVLVHAKTGRKLSEFREYVQPVHHPQLTDFCTQLTGITQETVDAGLTWPLALAQAQAWLDKQLSEQSLSRCIFVTCGDWDLKSMMGRQCALSGEHVPERFRQWINIKRLFASVTGLNGGSMKRMLDVLGLRLEGHHHSGLDDCRNIARILAELLRRVGSKFISVDIVSHAAQSAGYSNGKTRENASRHISQESRNTSTQASATSTYSPPLSSCTDDYSPRSDRASAKKATTRAPRWTRSPKN